MRVHKKRFAEVYEGELQDFQYHGKGRLTVEEHSQFTKSMGSAAYNSFLAAATKASSATAGCTGRATTSP
jgi:hypothetical protein